MSDYDDGHDFGDDQHDDLGSVQDASEYQHEGGMNQSEMSSSESDPGDVLGLLPGAPEPEILTELGSLMHEPRSDDDRESAYLGLGSHATPGGATSPGVPAPDAGRVTDTPAPSSTAAPSTPAPINQGELDSMMNSFEQADHGSTMAILGNLRV